LWLPEMIYGSLADPFIGMAGAARAALRAALKT
jgi:hypothetical protein